ncbi:MAG: rRNA maturation RNase YbeY [Salinivirgaceae bacterium]|nr:rRNA maturation RNase YbeY [Salinivirgaceae bacterium]MDD4746053.1 rRNA maturation RNase YbeY [Salinivirgaceae bacterium]MDY0279325.1 rRNA maturation RNase YbeY [Salinivirgaceae bacterium]
MINFYTDEVDFTYVRGFKKQCRKWLDHSAKNEDFTIRNLNIIVTNDENLLKINNDFLGHDFFTDIITFNYNDGNKIDGELYLSFDRIVENALLNKVDFLEEFNRVIIHGLLHLMGYNDSTNDQITLMRTKEDNYLKLF